jgi:hypothetical protein
VGSLPCASALVEFCDEVKDGVFSVLRCGS